MIVSKIMVCPVCNQRKAKRACPALGKQICTVCCGTKRLTEIACPDTCVYLTSARQHPPAVVQRQQEMDRAMVLPLLQGLSERQARIFLMLGALISRHQPDGLQQLMDDDIVQAAGALAATIETAGRGILYEHRPTSRPSAHLMTELKGLVEEIAKNAGSALERDAAIALRRVEHGAKAMVSVSPGTNEFQKLLGRVLAPPPGAAAAETSAEPAPSIILPP
jgi:hypothetical protein